MTFDLDITFESMKDKVQQSIQELPLEYNIDNTSKKQEVGPGVLLTIPRSLDRHAGDRYQKKGINLTESATQNAIAFQKSLPDLQRAEEFARE